ncbi:hypothetical protein JP33_10825 [Gallibacterium anatis CCM5995]|uniref:hypothetical protein n=1 Tax=Gallibacterium anatis TaxID=750 RepID=UPI000530CF09|nr:hypothetical protein [Gallibacterium anatis]KGQ23328.1 hypothetical protein JP33_10825 [Gallibacterium anatis CCM5995]
MKIFKTSFILLTTGLLFSCADLYYATNPEAVFDWTKFIDNKGNMQEATFFKSVTTKKEDAKGTINIKTTFSGITSHRELADLYLLDEYDKNIYLGIVNKSGDRYFSPYNKDDILNLKKESYFDLYEIGKGRISQTTYFSKNKLCQDFTSKNGILLNISSNYYDLRNKNIFYTLFIKAKVNNKKLLDKVDYSYEITANTVQQKEEIKTSITDQEVKKIVLVNLSEKASFLDQFICKK